MPRLVPAPTQTFRVGKTLRVSTWLPALALGAALTLGLLGLTILAWKDGYWSLAGRLHYTLVVAAAAGSSGSCIAGT